MESPKVTLKSIASKVGVTVSVVSRVLNNKKKMISISSKTKHDILDAAAEMGLRLNNNIGVVIPKVIADYDVIFHAFSAGVSNSANKHKYGVFTEILQKDVGDGDFIPEFLRTRSVSGVVFLYEMPREIREFLEDERIPYVFADCEGKGWPVNCLSIDYAKTMRELLSHLVSQGYTRLLLVSCLGNPVPYYFKQELDCFNEFLSENNLEGKMLLGTKKSRVELIDELDYEVRNATPQTAFIADSRFLTIKMLELFYAHGKKMPLDAGLVGNSTIADYTKPKLTARKISFYNFGETAIDMIDKIWRNKNRPVSNIMLQGMIMKNGSTQRTNARSRARHIIEDFIG